MREGNHHGLSIGAAWCSVYNNALGLLGVRARFALVKCLQQGL